MPSHLICEICGIFDQEDSASGFWMESLECGVPRCLYFLRTYA